MKKRIAMFKNLTYGTEFFSDQEMSRDGYKQLTAWVEVDLPVLEEPPEVLEIEKLIERETKEHNRRIQELVERRDQWASGEVNYTVKIGEAS